MMIKSMVSWLGVASILFFTIWFATAADQEAIVLVSEDLKQRKALLARLENLPKREDSIRKVLEDLDNGLARRSLYQGQASSIRTEIQRDVRNIASDTGIRIGAMRPIGGRVSSIEKIATSAIQLNFEATNKESMDFLLRIENAEPILRVRRLTVSTQIPSTPSRPAQLAFSVEVAGYVNSDPTQ